MLTLQVPVPEQQHRVMIEAVENHMPEVIVIDEIGSEAEALAAATIAQRGVQLVATAHGEHLENILNNPILQSLLGGVERLDSPLSLLVLAFLMRMCPVCMPFHAVDLCNCVGRATPCS